MFFDVLTSIGALSAFLGASIQLSLELGYKLSYTSRAKSLDKAGVKAAKRSILKVGYKNDTELPWIPKRVHSELNEVTPNFVGWMAVTAGTLLLFMASVRPIVQQRPFESREVAAWSILVMVALFIALVAASVVTAGIDRAGMRQAEDDWRVAHPEVKRLPQHPDRLFNNVTYWLHCKLLGSPSSGSDVESSEEPADSSATDGPPAPAADQPVKE